MEPITLTATTRHPFEGGVFTYKITIMAPPDCTPDILAERITTAIDSQLHGPKVIWFTNHLAHGRDTEPGQGTTYTELFELKLAGAEVTVTLTLQFDRLLVFTQAMPLMSPLMLGERTRFIDVPTSDTLSGIPDSLQQLIASAAHLATEHMLAVIAPQPIPAVS